MEIDVSEILDENVNEFNSIFPEINFTELNNEILTESILGNISSLISKVKSMLMKQERDIHNKKAMSQEFYKKWDRVYTDDEFNIYSMMNKRVFRLNSNLSMIDILTIIGLDVDKKAIYNNKVNIDLNEIRSLIIAGCMKRNVMYMKKMVNTQLYNGIFIGDDKNTRKITTPVEDRNMAKMIQGRVLGNKIKDEIDTDVFLYNSKEIPLIIKYNSSALNKLEQDTKIMISFIKDIIKKHSDIPEFPVFLDVFQHVIETTSSMVLEYNDSILLILDEMDKIYTHCEKSPLHESVVGYAEMDTYIEPIDESFTKLQKTEMDISYFGIPRLKKYPLLNEKQIRSAINDFENVQNHADKKEMAKHILQRIDALHLKGQVHVDENNPLAAWMPKWMVKKSSLNESVLCESAGHMKLYHISDHELDGTTLNPKIPNNYMTNNGYEDDKTPRVCFCRSINKSLMAISANLKGKKFYVHVPDKYDSKDVIIPTTKEVPDAKLTGEVWITKPVKLRCVGIILVGDSKGDGLPYTYGGNRAELYEWDWKWIKKNTNQLHESYISFDNIDVILESTSYEVGGYIEWERLNGDRYEGTIFEVDSNVLHVHCTDGIDRAVDM